MAKHFRDVHFGGNWTVSCLREQVSGLTWQQATANIPGFNTIAALVYHTNYFVVSILGVLRGGPLEGHDKFSFDLPPIRSQEDWEDLLNNVWADAESAATLIEQLPDSRLSEDFVDEKYGSWYRNIAGIIEHTHYHLGQIVMVKKMVTGQQ